MEWIESWEQLDWIKARTQSEPFGVMSRLIPRGYPAYCRILHPIFEDPAIHDHRITWQQADPSLGLSRLSEDMQKRISAQLPAEATLVIGSYVVPPGAHRVRWAQVAERYHQTLAPETNYGDMMDAAGFRSWPRYLLGPAEGDLGIQQSTRLSEVLSPYTGRGEEVWFSWFATHTKDWIGAMLKGTLNELPDVLLSDRVTSSPEYWWPEGKSWFVSTNVDATFTVVGGVTTLIERILADSEFESQNVTPDTSFSLS